jgi:DNA-binding transcriptional ArsR family regulator
MNIQELNDKSEEVAGLLALLGNEHRLRILCELNDAERSVSELERAIGISQSALSQHLARLREAGLVTTRREAQMIFYSIADPRISRLLALLVDLYCPQRPRRATGRAR